MREKTKGKMRGRLWGHTAREREKFGKRLRGQKEIFGGRLRGETHTHKQTKWETKGRETKRDRLRGKRGRERQIMGRERDRERERERERGREIFGEKERMVEHERMLHNWYLQLQHLCWRWPRDLHGLPMNGHHLHQQCKCIWYLWWRWPR